MGNLHLLLSLLVSLVSSRLPSYVWGDWDFFACKFYILKKEWMPVLFKTYHNHSLLPLDPLLESNLAMFREERCTLWPRKKLLKHQKNFNTLLLHPQKPREHIKWIQEDTNTIYVSEFLRDSELNALFYALEVTQVAYYLLDWNFDSLWPMFNEP